jgi:thioesterase domain-containing protein
MDQRFEFFAPIWRVMRDSNMTAEEVKEQVSYVALVTKQASQVSDLRSHVYTAPRVKSPVVYFRGFSPGVCTYFDDRKGPLVPNPHGACWYNRCDDLRIVDVPGDHFSLLRQDIEDMNVLVTALKMCLGPFGWAETLKREDKPAYEVSSEEIQDIDAYLRKMGVKDPSLRQRLETAMPYASADGVDSALAAAASGNSQAVAAMNPAAKQQSRQDDSDTSTPCLIVCCDANGTLGGLEDILAALDLPVYIVRVPANNEELWESADVPELATVAVKSLQRALPSSSRELILSGVGFGGVLAHEIALQLDAVSDRVAAFALFEGCHVVSNPSSTLNWLSTREQRNEICQAGAAVYPAVVAAAGADAPSIDAFVARLASINGFEAQLDYVASFKPKEEPSVSWDKRIDDALARYGYFKTITDSYTPSDVFPGQTLVFADPACASGNGLAHGGPGGVWNTIRFLVQPASIHPLSSPATRTSGISTGTALSPSAARAVAAVAASLCDQLRASVRRRAVDEARASGPSALSLMSPRTATDTTEETTNRSSYQHTPQTDTTNNQFTAADSPASTVCLILPLNRLCPERRYILRRAGRVLGGTPRQLTSSSTPITRLPLWMVHTERGDLSGAQKELAAGLPMPCYGLGMGADADQCSSIYELAAAYCSAVLEMQPTGPYLLMGTSVIGAVLAHAMAANFEAAGRPVALIILDGCIGTPSVPLHDSTWYALFYLLREIGSLRGAMGEFVDFVRGAGSPSQQLKQISSFKPADLGIPPEAWDAAVYATLDRAAALKRLLRVSTSGESGALAPKEAFTGPSAMVVPRDRLGRAFVEASRPYLAAGEDGVLVVPLEARHTEALLSSGARAAAMEAVTSAVAALLERLG